MLEKKRPYQNIDSKKGDEPHIGIKMIMDALHGGLEPPTYRLTADRSNQTEPMEHA